MMSKDVPDRLSVTSPPYTGVYQKRPGSRRDSTLFCWFNIEDEDDENDAFPHVSIHVDGNDLLDEMHVTFTIIKDGEKRRFANYYKVNGTKVTFVRESTDLGPVSKKELLTSGTVDWKGGRTNLYQGDADRFAEAFINAAAYGRALPPYVPKQPEHSSPFVSHVPPKAAGY